MQKALTLDYERNQGVNLGNRTDVCFAEPHTCGAAGGAVAFWIRIGESRKTDYIITSLAKLSPFSTGFYLLTHYGDFR